MKDWLFARWTCLVTITALLLCLLMLMNCVGATRLPARSRGPGGSKIEPKQIAVGFVEVGTTTRQEVLDRLSTIDTGYSSPRLFWGRWANSKWGYWWIVAAPGSGAAGDAKRVWHLKNFVVAFNENGVVQSTKEFDEDSALWRELHSHLPNLARLDLPLSIYAVNVGRRGRDQIILGKEFIEVPRHKKSSVQIAPHNVVRISHEGTPDKRADPGATCHTLHFSQKTALGKQFRLCADGPQVIALFQYLDEAGPKDMRWE